MKCHRNVVDVWRDETKKIKQGKKTKDKLLELVSGLVAGVFMTYQPLTDI